LHGSIVWCWDTPSAGVCSGFTEILFRTKGCIEVIAWTPSLFGRRASIMELSSPETVWYARVLLLFSASAMTDTGSKSFDYALFSTLETFDDAENGKYSFYTYYCNDVHYGNYAYYSHYSNYI
jgi:hypothetical protein